jgi:hypothetical protein
MDTIRSSSRNKPGLTSQLAEEDPEPISTTKEASPAPARNLNPVIQVVPPVSVQKMLVVPAPQTPMPAPQTPVPAPQTPMPAPPTPLPAPQTPVPAPRKLEPDEPERKEDDKEKAKEGSKLTRKLKQLYKGEIFKRVSCNVCGIDIKWKRAQILCDFWRCHALI